MKQCQRCAHNQKTKCEEMNRMTLEEYEDYFIDKVKTCPYKKVEDKNDLQ